MQCDLLHDSEYEHLFNKEFWEKWRGIISEKDADLHLAHKKLPRIWVNIICFEKLMEQYFLIHAIYLRATTEKIL